MPSFRPETCSSLQFRKCMCCYLLSCRFRYPYRFVSIEARQRACVHKCVCVCICMYICIYACLSLSLYIYIYIYIKGWAERRGLAEPRLDAQRRELREARRGVRGGPICLPIYIFVCMHIYIYIYIMYNI